MTHVTGYFLRLSSNRELSFEGRIDEKFAEPVPEFSHSRNVPLICFIINEKGSITSIGYGKRGFTAGTDLRRLNISNITILQFPIPANEVAEETSPRLRQYLLSKVLYGGLISQKSFDEFMIVLLRRSKEISIFLNKYSGERRLRIEKLSVETRKILAEQKEAVLTALNIAGIDKSQALGWDYSEDIGPISFLDGLEKVSLREDSMIINDLVNLPGFELLKTTKYSSSVFENERTRLTVLLTNRLPLEELLGTDLIYYNEDIQCFIMVQYKVMDKENDKYVFRVPNSQLTSEILRMDEILQYLNTQQTSNIINDFRINTNPFFLKICPKIEFDPDNAGLSSGMYIPLEYFKLLQNSENITGPKGGKVILYENVGRYFDNTAFKTVIEGGWIGTNILQSKIIEALILKTLKEGKAAVVAIKKSRIFTRGQNTQKLVDADFGFNLETLPF